VRKDSPYFGQHFSIELTENNSKSLWIPEGFAHGFQALEDNTRVLYKVTNYWSKEKERSLNFRDKSLNIAWVDIPVSASQKDIESPSLDKI
jgi:dTDP-4-dehydrorhamnose 3,5-epimerase